MKIIKRAEEIDKLNTVEVPFHVWRVLGGQCKTIFINSSTDISLAEDYANIDEIKKALEWYVDQFNGKVTWKKK